MYLSRSEAQDVSTERVDLLAPFDSFVYHQFTNSNLSEKQATQNRTSLCADHTTSDRVKASG